MQSLPITSLDLRDALESDSGCSAPAFGDTMSHNKKNGGSSAASGGRKDSRMRNKNNKRGNTQNDKKKGGPLTIARPLIVAPVQWAGVFLLMMLKVPVKGARKALTFFTRDDVIEEMTTLPPFVADPNLAIDTFRELKEKNQEDAFGQRFDFGAFKSLLSSHPTLKSLRLKRDQALTDALYNAHTRPKMNRALNNAFNEGMERFLFILTKEVDQLIGMLPKNWKENIELVIEMYHKEAKDRDWTPTAKHTDALKEVLKFRGLCYPDIPTDSKFAAVWQFEETRFEKNVVKTGNVLSKTQYRNFFNQYYRLEGADAPATAYSLKGTVKVQPKSVIRLSNCHSHSEPKGDPVNVDVDWVVVEVPKKGDGEFYLNRIMKFGDETVNPAYGHLLSDKLVLKAWNNAGLMRLGWRPDSRLSAAYGPDVENVLTDEYALNYGEMMATLKSGETMQVTNGHWTILQTDGPRPKKQKKSNNKMPKTTGNSDTGENVTQPTNVG